MTGNLVLLCHNTKHAPSIEPCIGKSSQDFCKAVLADVRDVLEEEPFGFVREFSGGHADDFEEKFAALSFQAPSSPRSADVLARETRGDDIDSSTPEVSLEGGSVKGSHVFVYRRLMEVAGRHAFSKDRLAPRVDLAIQSACGEGADGEVEPGDSREQAETIHASSSGKYILERPWTH